MLEILNECKYSIDKHEEKKLIHNIINTIEFSSVNIDPALIGLCKQLQSDLKNETVSPSRLKDSLANIADRL
ncbi:MULTISPECIES: hypothetical protein [Prochlorococcus]|uniref:hypothetical protein n=1 Tax=Prochlorococcus TaxID=1218 RepID=UPI0013E8BDBF|nr:MULTISPECIES: hypothetical protein [Prochlorococcus]